MDLHVFPILIPPPASLPIPSLWVFPVHQPRAPVSCNWCIFFFIVVDFVIHWNEIAMPLFLFLLWLLWLMLNKGTSIDMIIWFLFYNLLMCHIDWIVNIESSMHPWDKSYLRMAYDPFTIYFWYNLSHIFWICFFKQRKQMKR